MENLTTAESLGTELVPIIANTANVYVVQRRIVVEDLIRIRCPQTASCVVFTNNEPPRDGPFHKQRGTWPISWMRVFGSAPNVCWYYCIVGNSRWRARAPRDNNGKEVVVDGVVSGWSRRSSIISRLSASCFGSPSIFQHHFWTSSILDLTSS